MAIFYVVIAIAMVTFVALARNFFDLKNHDEGTDEMKDLAGIIRDGSKTFLTREYRIIVPAVVAVSIIYIFFIEIGSGFTFILGALMSSCACLIGMSGGTYGNVRTTNAARVTKHMSRTIRIALMSGSISGFAVPAFGIFGACVVWIASGGINFDATSTSLLGMFPGVNFGTVSNPLTMRLTTGI